MNGLWKKIDIIYLNGILKLTKKKNKELCKKFFQENYLIFMSIIKK